MPWVRRAVAERWHPHLSPTTLIVAAVLCQFMDHRTGGGMRPGWARLITSSRVCRSTVARHLAALRQAGLLVTVAGGTHLTHHQRRDTGRIADAAVYAGMIPGPPPTQRLPVAGRRRTPPLSSSLKLRDLSPVTRTRTPLGRRPARPGTAAATGYDLADAYRARYPHTPVSVEVTRGWLAFELRPLAMAGWTPTDVAAWLDQRPMPPTIRRPLGWLRARLRGAVNTEPPSAAAARQAACLRADQAVQRERKAREVAAKAPADAVRRVMADIRAGSLARRIARATDGAGSLARRIARATDDSAVLRPATVSGRGGDAGGHGHQGRGALSATATATAAVLGEGVGREPVPMPALGPSQFEERMPR